MNKIDLLKQGNERIVKDIYESNKQKFIAFARKYSIATNDANDLYQEAMVALIENVQKGRLDNLQSTIETYLFAIGKFMLFSFLKKENKMATIYKEDKIEWNTYDDELKENQTILLQKNFALLGEQCKKLLTLFYYEEKKLNEIMSLMNYENKDVVKSQKYRCLKQLKNMLSKNG